MKMMQILKNRKGFTLMELIVVLIIIAILMAALLPSLIGWINDARESALRVDGRTALLAIQGVVTEAAGTGYWNTSGGRTPFDYTTEVTPAMIIADTKFKALIEEAKIYGGTAEGVFAGVANTTPGVIASDGLRLEGHNVVGLYIANIVGTNRNSDGIRAGVLLVGREAVVPGGGGDPGGGGEEPEGP